MASPDRLTEDNISHSCSGDGFSCYSILGVEGKEVVVVGEVGEGASMYIQVQRISFS